MNELKVFLTGFKKLTIIGIGSELRQDDGVGIYIAQQLQEGVKNPKVTVLIGGTTPENLTGVLRRDRPSHILLIDAAQTGQKPGAIVLVEPAKIVSAGFSTHTFSLGKIADYMKEVSGAQIMVLGVEPQNVSFGEGLSPVVLQGARQVVAELQAALL